VLGADSICHTRSTLSISVSHKTFPYCRSSQALTISFVLTVTCYNCAVVYVTKFLSAIWHAILDNFRPITIWCVFLCFVCCVGIGEVSFRLHFLFSTVS
jgi:hypothetical protein